MEEPKIAGTAVRLICRYSNGLTKSVVGRAVSFEDQMLKVLCNESFDPGIPLTVMSAFLTSNRIARVKAVERGQQAGSFVLELRLKPPDPVPVKAPPPAPAPVAIQLSLPAAAATLAARLEATGTAPFYKAVFETATVREKEGWAISTAAALFLLLASKEKANARQVLMKLGTPQ